MNQELAFKIINKRKLVSFSEAERKVTEFPIIVRAKVTNANRDYRNEKSPDQIGILSFALMTDWYMEQAVRFIKEGEYQLALNQQCTKSVYKGDFFPNKGTFVDVSLDFVEVKSKQTGETTQALMVVGVQPPMVTKTSSAGEKLKALLSGNYTKEKEEENDENLFSVPKKTSL